MEKAEERKPPDQCPLCKQTGCVGENLIKRGAMMSEYDYWYTMDDWYCYSCCMTFN